MAQELQFTPTLRSRSPTMFSAECLAACVIPDSVTGTKQNHSNKKETRVLLHRFTLVKTEWDRAVITPSPRLGSDRHHSDNFNYTTGRKHTLLCRDGITVRRVAIFTARPVPFSFLCPLFHLIISLSAAVNK